jgi:CelD/BcsL family acetyltransferase involved in cellulose biosynthesis
MRKLRHAERNAGPLRLEHQSDSPAVFQQLIDWKIAQYRRTGATNVLAFDWTVALLERIRTARHEGFSGVTSVLYLGDRLAAILLSMRSYAVLHAWFPAYEAELAHFSPGLLLWLELARTCPELSIRRIDLGKGPEEYKTHLMSGTIDVAEGSVDLRPMMGMVRRNWRRAYDWASRSPLRRPLLTPGRILRNMVASRSFRS